MTERAASWRPPVKHEIEFEADILVWNICISALVFRLILRMV